MAISPKTPSCFVRSLTPDQVQKLRVLLDKQGWEVKSSEHCSIQASGNQVSVSAYHSGKLVVQGKNAAEFIEFFLEPQVTGVPEPTPETHQEPFSPHAGMDESGKGDFFGPLVVACVFVPDEAAALRLADAGVKDSKKIKNDAAFAGLASKVLAIVERKAGLVVIGPESYNRLYDSFGSLNRLLAWGHARALENLLEKAPECNRALADQFGEERLIQNALLKAGRTIRLDQRTKAESDIAVAAASILARAEFVRRMKLLGTECGRTLPKGAGTQVDLAASALAASGGETMLRKFAKMHFRNSFKALGLPMPEKTEWRKH